MSNYKLNYLITRSGRLSYKQLHYTGHQHILISNFESQFGSYNLIGMTSQEDGPAVLERVCGGEDDRVQVDPMTSPPYKWICSLVITAANGSRYLGSGFKIHIPNVDRTIVVTAGHCVYMQRSYVSSISVTFPGQETVNVDDRDCFYAALEFRRDKDGNFDYGMIALPGNSDEGFGWSAIIPDEELEVERVTNCGYPADKPWPQMWITGGSIYRVSTHKLNYFNDTMGGQSGSPVYLWYKGYWTVVAVHNAGACPNSATKFSSEMIYRFLKRAQNLKKYALRSSTFVHVCVRCDGDGVTEYDSSGGGTINCQYEPPSDWETFYIYPVEVTPSLAQVQKQIVVLQNVEWSNTFVRMDGTDITQFKSPGGGVVNCQWSGKKASRWESFVLKQDDQQRYYFESEEFRRCYIRLDGSSVTSYSRCGRGEVNCQYCSNEDEVSGWEKFTLEERH